jgi:hypothetical protein
MDMEFNLNNGCFESCDKSETHNWQTRADIGG